MKETEEYREAMAVLRRELKPNEYMSVEFPEGHPIYERIKHPVMNIRGILAREIADRGLNYDLKVRGRAVYVVAKNHVEH